MTADKTQALSNIPRQKIIMGVFVVIILFFLWEARGMFSSTPPPAPQVAKVPPLAQRAANGQQPQPNQNGAMPQQPPSASATSVPQQNASVPASAPMTPREAELMRLQQETEAKYLAALNELQVLKVDREIAETNKAIATAKLDTVTAQKGIVDLLTQPSAPKNPYAQNLPGLAGVPLPGTQQTTAQGTAPLQQPKEISYTVVSVTEIQYRWSAVLSSEGNLYNVHIGDVLPADGSRVISINKSGVVIEKAGKRKKISMVPVI